MKKSFYLAALAVLFLLPQAAQSRDCYTLKEGRDAAIAIFNQEFGLHVSREHIQAASHGLLKGFLGDLNEVSWMLTAAVECTESGVMILGKSAAPMYFNRKTGEIRLPKDDQCGEKSQAAREFAARSIAKLFAEGQSKPTMDDLTICIRSQSGGMPERFYLRGLKLESDSTQSYRDLSATLSWDSDQNTFVVQGRSASSSGFPSL